MRKFVIVILLIAFATCAYSIEYTPISSDSYAPLGSNNPNATIEQQTQTLSAINNQIITIQAQLTELNSKIDKTATVDNLGATAEIILHKQNELMTFYFLLYGIMLLLIFLMAGAVFFLLKGRGRA